MSVIVVIPARYASTRYPGKPLVALTGADGQARTLIQRSWEAAMAARGADEVHVVMRTTAGQPERDGQLREIAAHPRP